MQTGVDCIYWSVRWTDSMCLTQANIMQLRIECVTSHHRQIQLTDESPSAGLDHYNSSFFLPFYSSDQNKFHLFDALPLENPTENTTKKIVDDVIIEDVNTTMNRSSPNGQPVIGASSFDTNTRNRNDLIACKWFFENEKRTFSRKSF